MRVGIIGAGQIGQAFARQLARAGLGGVIAGRRGPASLAAVARRLGPSIAAGTVAEAADPEIVLLAVPWPRVAEALAAVVNWDGRILLDATNAIGASDVRPSDPGRPTSSEVVAGLAPGARVVKAFNTLAPEILSADPREAGGRRVIFFSGDHPPAKAETGRLIDRLGFAGVDLGRLGEGGRLQQFPGGPLPALNLIRLA